MSMDTAISIVNLFMENLPGALWLIFFIYVGMRTGIIPSSRDIDEINRNISRNVDEINRNMAKSAADINDRISRNVDEINRNMAKSATDINERISRNVDEINRNMTKIAADINGRISRNVDEINRNMTRSATDINEKINKINETLAKQTTAVNILMNREKLGSMASESPLKLSEKGERISRNVNAEEIVNSRLDELRPEFEALSNNYDIQEKAMELGESIYDDLPEDVKNSVKNEIYQIGFQLFQVYPIFSLILRDAILKERKQGDGGKEKIPAAQPSP